MKRTPAPADVQRWSDEVARDPGAPSFVPLADAYRRQGNRDGALRLCLRGLERNPTNVEAHTLLARLYLEGGDREKAFDEWSMVLRLDGAHFEANRGMGFVHLERGDFGTARRHLEQAAASKPGDAAVGEALNVLEERLGDARATPSATGARVAAPAARAPVTRDPARLFDGLSSEPPFIGALVMDTQGLVLAGALSVERAGGAEALGAMLGGAVQEAARTAEYLRLGEWRGMLMESDAAQIHITPIGEDLMVLLAARADAPVGWVVRAAAHATGLGRAFVREGL